MKTGKSASELAPGWLYRRCDLGCNGSRLNWTNWKNEEADQPDLVAGSAARQSQNKLEAKKAEKTELSWFRLVLSLVTKSPVAFLLSNIVQGGWDTARLL